MAVGERYTCPCCGYLSFAEPPGSYDICEICYWEDDFAQLRDPSSSGGANTASLLEAQANFVAYGWCEERVAPYVPMPRTDEVRDPEWRRIEPGSTDLDGALGTVWTDGRVDLDKIYYWRRRRA